MRYIIQVGVRYFVKNPLRHYTTQNIYGATIFSEYNEAESLALKVQSDEPVSICTVELIVTNNEPVNRGKED